jgi:hypothetical protein
MDLQRLFSNVTKPPPGFQGRQLQSQPLRRVTPLASQPTFLQPPLSASSIAAPPRSLKEHPLFQGISSDAEIVRLKRENPECAELIDYCLRRFGSRILEKYRPLFVQDLINEFKIRTNGRTPQQMIQLMEQPCYEIEIESNFNDIQKFMRESASENEDAISQYLIGKYKGYARTAVHGLDDVYHQEIISENGIVKNARTQRGTAKWSRKPCGVRMLHEDYLSLPASERKYVDDAYRMYGLTSESALEALGVEGGHKKTKKRNKKPRKKVNVRRSKTRRV